MKLSGISQVEVVARRGNNLDTVCFRGFAPLAHLAAISQADVFDQDKNPDGLQRDLSPKHASEAYDYVRRERVIDQPRAFPEVVLNVRDKKVVEIEELNGGSEDHQLVRLKFNLDRMRDDAVHVSRVDGNHRLFYAQGDDRTRDPLLTEAPFQIHVGLTREQERSLFVDINSNQKGLNSSHLAVMQSKLTPEQREIRDHLDRWIATRLASDPESPWHGLIHLGGSKKGARAQGLTRLANFASLQSGVGRTLAKSQYIHDLTDANAQYAIIRNYWQAVRTVFSEEWASPKDYLLLRNTGVLSMSILAGTIIDRCMPQGRAGISDMAFYLRQAHTRFEWSTDGELAGMSGNRAALTIAGAMAEELADETGLTAIRDLQNMLVGQTSG
ncbi:MAG: DGQHR domain-containing protein [Dehalococcoidia bacterium]|nr:DGQHR domain-containing protein [Dehalococcoidia bacterium]